MVYFSLHHRFQTDSVAHPLSYLITIWGSYYRCETDHSHLSADIKNVWSYTSFPSIRLHSSDEEVKICVQKF
jgi:hypothetical protein